MISDLESDPKSDLERGAVREIAMSDVPSFGAWLKRRRKAFDLTQDALAQLVGCAVVTIRKIEAEVQPPSRQLAERLAEHLAIPEEQRKTFIQFARVGLDAAPPELPLPEEARVPAPPTTRLVAQPTPGEAITLVGRTQEWAQLQAAWRAATEGRTQVMLLAGEAGIGKTRLAEELTRWVARQVIATATARCYAAEGALAYAPVTAWLRSDALRPALSRLDTVWLTEVARLLPELLVERPDLPRPTPLTEPWQHQHLRDALARAILGSRRPLLLFIDDLQWCDLETLEWLHYLLRFNHQAPLLLAGTIRSEELAAEHPLTTWLAAVRRATHATEIELSPFDQAETVELVAQITGAAPDPAMAIQVYAETEGNPLFVVETARAGIAPGPQPLPTTMKDMIATRLAQLAVPTRDLVQVAATIGRSFTIEVLSRAAESDEDALVRGLDELWQRRIVREHSDNTYDFSHDKIREVAYGEMTAARRRLLHRRVAVALEAVHGDNVDAVSGQIAAHYERASQARPAVAYYRRAAEVARQVYANAYAIDYYQRALTLLDIHTDREQIADLLERLGDLLELTGQHDEAGDAYRRALESAELEALARARLLRKQGVVLTTQRRYSEAQQLCDAAEVALGQAPGDEDMRWWQEWVQIQIEHVMLHYWQAHTDQIGALVEKTRPMVERYGTPAQRAGFFRGLSWFHLRRDRYVISPETLNYAQRCLEAQQQAGDLSEQAYAHFVLGFAWLWYDDFDAAEQEMIAALGLAERSGDVTTQSRCLTYLTIVERKRGHIDTAREYVRRSLAVAVAGQMFEYLGAAKGNLAWLAWRGRDLAESHARGQEALELWGQLTITYPFHWTALWPLIGVTLAHDQVAETIDHVRHLLEPTQQRMPNVLETILQEALDEWEQGHPKQARERLLQAVEQAKGLGFL
jgi:transcriptional regulator with XRE-family HTH domain/tetratricopeptide (TPR) repeat protein